MKKRVLFGLFFVLCLAAGQGFAYDTGLLEQADRSRAEKSYQIAITDYRQLLEQKDLPDNLGPELRFKLADCLWRSGGEQREQEGEKILKDILELRGHDRWRAEAQESLARYDYQKDRWSHGQEIIDLLMAARDYWAGATDVELARERFVDASFLLAEHITNNWGSGYRNIRPTGLVAVTDLPGVKEGTQTCGLDLLYREILKVAEDPEPKARATYLLGKYYLDRSYTDEERELADKYFSDVIELYPDSEWLDDVYYDSGQMDERRGDFVKALESYRDLLERFPREQSRWWDDAKQRIREITSPQLSVGVGYTFLPDSEVRFSMAWRNIKAAKMALYRIDLVRELRFQPGKNPSDSSFGINSYSGLVKRMVDSRQYLNWKPVKSWRKTLEDEGLHKHHRKDQGLAEWLMTDDQDKVRPEQGKLPAGAYLLLVTAAGEIAYDLILVTDLGMTVKTAGRSALFYTFDARTGRPRPGLEVRAHYRYYDENGRYTWSEVNGRTDENGLLMADLAEARREGYSNPHDLFAAASDGEQQAFVRGSYSSYSRGGSKGDWWLYAFSDRPAYRPNEEIGFKGLFRRYNGADFVDVEGLTVKGRLIDPRGNVVREKEYTLNAFGSFHDTLTLDDQAPLGEYRLEIRSMQNNNTLASATLFRLEEYKLPEFQVSIEARSEADGASSAFKLGQTMKVRVEAQYYFGGPVQNADVELKVYQAPYHHHYSVPREYAWYYDKVNRYDDYGQGTLIKNETLTTDEHGIARLEIGTPKDAGRDLKYTIEARVVDQSRREITARSEIKVTQKGFYAYLNPRSNLYRPGDKVEVDLKTLTANNQPVRAEGKITVTRNWWREAVVKDERIAEPAHYSGQELFTRFVSTDKQGSGVFEFSPDQDGYYSVEFTGFDSDGDEVTGTAHVYVCTAQSRDIGYRHGGLQIIMEKDTYRPGDTARLMLVSDRPDTWVLFTVETGEILGHALYHLEGPVKMIELPVREEYTPNVFVQALSGEDYQLKTYQQEIVVPPEDKFLNVKIISDKEVYQPREEGVVDIELTDHAGEPVSAEVALGMVDQSVYYIQGEYAPDIRQFFYGDKRAHEVQTQSSFQQRRYEILRRNDKEELVAGEKILDGKEAEVKKAKGMRLSSLEGVGDMGFALDEEVAGQESPALMAATGEMRERAAAAPMEDRFDKDASRLLSKQQNEAQPLAEPELRTDFRSTVIWQPVIATGPDGKAQVRVIFPDSLTTWQTTARAITLDTRVGNVTHEVRTKKPVIVRLQAPRFFTERDEVVISANAHNYTEEEQKMKVTLETDDLAIEDDPSVWVTVPPGGEQRVDWKTKVTHVPEDGRAALTVMAQAEDAADAMRKTYPVRPYGMEQFIAHAVAVKGKDMTEDQAVFTIDLPKQRAAGSTSLELVLSPSLAGALLDALPYLADYPYGCVEQTMSRFLPALIVAKTLKDQGLGEKQVTQYIRHVLEPSGDPQGHPRRTGEVSFTKLRDMTNKGLKRLYDFQHSDGGWGWWKEGDSDRFMSAYVVWGLALAKQSGAKVKSDVLARGIHFLTQELVEEEDNPDMLAWILHALAEAGSQSRPEEVQRERLWKMRDELNPYTRALFALSEQARGHTERAEVLARNLANGIQEDAENRTAHWGESGVHYRWSEGGVEATAFVIKALSNIDPSSPYLEPAVRWMALNRRGSRWKNTRDTAIAILGLSDYLKTTAEMNPDYEYEILLNGRSVRRGQVTPENLFTFDRRLILPEDELKTGKNTVELRFAGRGAMYLAGYLKYFTRENKIREAGNEIFVQRKYSRLSTQETLLKGYVEDWKPLEDGDVLTSGERVRVEITLEAKNHYEYLVVEDFKSAGLEAVELKSGSGYVKEIDEKGYDKDRQIRLYKEFRDEKAVFFITKLPQGRYKITYELRAEVPGTFQAMPDLVHAMYVPEIRANSRNAVMEVKDKN